jgi:hypothetical protein
MNTVLLGRFGAAACAMVVTAVGAWAFVSSTAAAPRDPFQFASIMAANAESHDAQTAAQHRGPQRGEVRVSGLPGLVAPVPACSGRCS